MSLIDVCFVVLFVIGCFVFYDMKRFPREKKVARTREVECSWAETQFVLNSLWDILEMADVGVIESQYGRTGRERFAKYLVENYEADIVDCERLYDEMNDRFNPQNCFIRGNVINLPAPLREPFSNFM